MKCSCNQNRFFKNPFVLNLVNMEDVENFPIQKIMEINIYIYIYNLLFDI